MYTFLRPGKERTVLLEGIIHLDDLSAGEELHDHSTRDNRGNAQFHQRSSV